MPKGISALLKNILWATDFSRESRFCLPYIKYLSGKIQTKNHALHVLPKLSDWIMEEIGLDFPELTRAVQHTKEKSIRRIEAESNKYGIQFQADSREGIVSEEIVTYSEEQKIDAVFLGRKGISEIENMWMGSTTSRLVRRSSIPVFVIPRARKAVRIRKILSPVDFNTLSLQELRFTIALAKLLDARIEVIHVSQFFKYRIPVLHRERLRERISTNIHQIARQNNYTIGNIIYEEGEPAHRILKTAERSTTDLIIMATHQRKGVEKFFLGSVTEKVFTYSDVPVLILPPSRYVPPE